MLTVENFSALYQQNGRLLPAVSDITFSLAAGENLGIVGESGCGKTTLSLGIMGLLRGAAVSGRVLFHGHDLSAMPERARRHFRWLHMAMVFQNSLEILNPVLTVAEQLTEPMTTHLGLPVNEARERVAEMLLLTGLDHKWLAAYPHQISGGMRQRVLIAMALVCKPELLIVDEPTNSLDPDSREAILDLLESLQNSLGFSMILISHNLQAVRRLTGRLLTMYAGRIVEEGETGDVMRMPLHPYTRGLINSAPELFPYKDLWGIPGAPPRPETIKGCGFAERCCQVGEHCAIVSPDLVEKKNGWRIACHKGGIETVLSACGIHKNFYLGKEKIRALNGVDLHIRRGEVVALVGRSGSGKSTLAQILVRSLAADKGIIHFLGEPVSNSKATAAMGGMQLVFQDPSEAISHRLTVLEAVREPLDIIGFSEKKERDERVRLVLAAMHLPTSEDFLSRACHGLSGGQRQRVAIARALVTDPILLVADEITAMLDPSTQAVVLRELKRLQHERGFSMLFISHNIHVARKVADRVYVLDRGFVIEQDTVFENLTDQTDNPAFRMPEVIRN